MKKITVVFPMAGEGQRFGNKFKPFLKIFNKTFIELAVEPFLKHADDIKRIVFIVRDDHRIEFNVIQKLEDLNLSIPSSVISVEPTKNVIETISPLFDEKRYLKDVIFCDCDHWLNVDAIFKEIHKDEQDCIIPGWDINPIESKSWSIAAINNDGAVKAIAEKKYPDQADRFYGVIGCYYFKRITQPDHTKIKYLSEVVQLFLMNGRVKLIPVKQAEFFGDPQRLENLYISKNACTIFCDLDGTMIEHENTPDYSRGFKLLSGAKEKVKEWRNNYAFIVLTTSRDEQFRPEVELMLRESGITYEYLVMGLPPGPRYLINDKKPYSDIEMAKAFEVERNIGIASIGHSFASIKNDGNVITKSLPADVSQHQRDKFKAQFETMDAIKRFNPAISDLVPTVSNFTGLSYNIEYLSDYKGLHQFPVNERLVILDNLFEDLKKLYTERINKPGHSWLFDFFNTKIVSKKTDLQELGLNTIIIDELRQLLKVHYEELKPSFLSTFFHGDLTYENIMVKGEDIKLIDFDDDSMPGPVELDLGKLMQSILTNYEFWGPEVPYWEEGPEFEKIVGFYSGLLRENPGNVIKKAYFYCILHLIRMIPYQAKKDKKRAETAYWWAENLTNELHGTF